ncbi:MAG: histidinol-phosphatase [Verrucomicrobiota bacterium]
MSERLVYETHMHTPLCKHAQGHPEEYAKVALDKGFKGIIVTCHGPLPYGISSTVRMSPDQWQDYVELVDSTREQFKGQLDIRLGLESDYLPGIDTWIEELHQRADLHYVLGSVHPHIKEYKERYLRWDWPDFHRQYFESLVDAAESGFFDCLSHPDIVKNLGHEEWDLDSHLDHIAECLDRIAATGVAMELNTSGLNKTIPEMNPSLPILCKMQEREIPVVVGADAHVPARVGADYLEAYNQLEAAGYEQVRIFLDRTPQDINISDARSSLDSGN